MTLEQLQQSIVERFDKKFADPFGDVRPDEKILAYSVDSNAAKSFLIDALREVAQKTAEAGVVKEKMNIITEKRRLTYSDVDDAYRLAREQSLSQLKAFGVDLEDSK